MKEKHTVCYYCREQISQKATKCPYCQSETKKSQKISIGKIITIILSSLGLIFIACVVFILYIMTNVDNKYTGQELFDAINEYRKSINVKELELDSALCDNLVERWHAIRNPGNGHKGFEEWTISEGLANKNGTLNPPYKTIAELYGSGTQTYWLIDYWTGSPGHKLSLENPNFNVGCAYASDGTGVLIMAEKQL